MNRFIFAVLLTISAPSHAAELTCDLIPEMFKMFYTMHFKFNEMTPELRDRTVTEFIKRLDPSRTLFYASEAEELEGKIREELSTLPKGQCKSLIEARTRIAERTKEVEDYVRSIVGKDSYEIDRKAKINLDATKRPFPKNIIERNRFLDKWIHFQMASYVVAGEKMVEARKNLIHRYEIFTKRAKEQENHHVYELLVESLAAALDPHSSYFTPEYFEDFQISMRLSLEGIGVMLTSKDGYVVVEEIVPGGAAARLKVLQPKDKIIAVSQNEGKTFTSVIDWKLSDVVQMIRGKKGTKVTLSVLRQGENTERFNLTIVRDKIDLKDQAAKLSYETREIEGKKKKFAIIELPSFYGGAKASDRSSYRDMRDLLVKVQKAKVDGLILDLTKNGGGLLDEAVRITGLFIRKGGVVAVKHSRRPKELLEDENEDIAYSGPMVVLTSRLSASASEILAGALKAYHRAVIAGDDHTFGKGSVQAVQTLPANLGAIKATTGMFYVPNGVSTQWDGVAADVVVPSLFATKDMGERNLDYSLKAEKIDAFVSSDANFEEPEKKWTPVTDDLVSKLKSKSKSRVKKNSEFKEIAEKIEKANKNEDLIELSELMEEQQDAKKKDDASKDKSRIERQREQWKPQLDEAVSILVDWVSAS